MTEIEFNKLKPKIEKLKDDLNNIGLENNEFSILEEIKPDCFNLTESKGNGFLVFYLDERVLNIMSQSYIILTMLENI